MVPAPGLIIALVTIACAYAQAPNMVPVSENCQHVEGHRACVTPVW